jgi:Zinc-binding loop region of homing endonuclease
MENNSGRYGQRGPTPSEREQFIYDENDRKMLDRHRKALLQPQFIARLKREIEAVTGKAVAPNDITEEEEHGSQDFKLFQVPYDHLIVAAHQLLVTGTRGRGPADITSTTHWLSNGSRNDNKRLYTRVGVCGIAAVPAHQITFAVFKGRRAAWGVSENTSLQANERKVQLARCISHLCRVPLCINPDHLIAETTTENDVRQHCGGARFCLMGEGHGEDECILSDPVSAEFIERHTSTTGNKMTFEERMTQIAAARTNAPEAPPVLLPSPARRLLIEAISQPVVGIREMQRFLTQGRAELCRMVQPRTPQTSQPRSQASQRAHRSRDPSQESQRPKRNR